MGKIQELHPRPNRIQSKAMLEQWDIPLEEAPLVVLDTEATGLYPGLGHRLTEVAAVRYEKWRQVAKLNEIVYPERPIGAQASRVSGLTDADVSGKPLLADIAPNLLDIMDGAVMVAHNAPFDANLISLELFLSQHLHGRDHLPITPRQPLPDNPWLCTLLLARGFFSFGKNTLTNIAFKLGVPVGRTHRALNDVYLTAEVLKRMARELREQQNLHTVADLLHAQGAPIYANPAPAVALPPQLADLMTENAGVTLLFWNGEGEQIRQTRLLYAIEHRGQAHLITQEAPNAEPLVVPWRQVLACHRLRE
jgi:DNA polymerase III epsilon subunit family exonuclease